MLILTEREREDAILAEGQALGMLIFRTRLHIHITSGQLVADRAPAYLRPFQIVPRYRSDRPLLVGLPAGCSPAVQFCTALQERLKPSPVWSRLYEALPTIRLVEIALLQIHALGNQIKLRHGDGACSLIMALSVPAFTPDISAKY